MLQYWNILKFAFRMRLQLCLEYAGTKDEQVNPLIAKRLKLSVRE